MLCVVGMSMLCVVGMSMLCVVGVSTLCVVGMSTLCVVGVSAVCVGSLCMAPLTGKIGNSCMIGFFVIIGSSVGFVIELDGMHCLIASMSLKMICFF